MPGCVPLCQCAFSGASMRALTPACVLLYQHACFYASMAATMSGASMPATIVAWRERKSVLPFFPLNASINVAFACICVMRTFKEQKIVLFLPSCGLNINIISKMNTMFARVCCVPQEMRASVLRVALGLCAEAPDTRMLTAIPLLLAVNCRVQRICCLVAGLNCASRVVMGVVSKGCKAVKKRLMLLCALLLVESCGVFVSRIWRRLALQAPAVPAR
eukprot:scaffold61154_cov19-Tisochrysis_lutea.AAC.1